MVWGVPILFCAHYYVASGRYHAYLWSVLSGVSEPGFSHVWVSLPLKYRWLTLTSRTFQVIFINGASAFIAATCIRQMYTQLKADLEEFNPSLKKFCIDAVLFLSVYQTVSPLAENRSIQRAGIKITVASYRIDSG